MTPYLRTLQMLLLNLPYVEHEPARRKGDEGSPEVRRNRRIEGRDWPMWAATMVGKLRLDDLHNRIVEVTQQGIPGDVVETGVWRGGAMIFARAVLNEIGSTDRKVWLVDSFEGLPPENTSKWPQDLNSPFFALGDIFAVGLEEVRANFSRFEVPLEGVEFLKGWFEDTLPGPLSNRPISILRLDGDMYGSTMHVLRTLYDNVSPGGSILIDDYGAIPVARRATQDFWAERGLKAETEQVDWTCWAWRKE